MPIRQRIAQALASYGASETARESTRHKQDATSAIKVAMEDGSSASSADGDSGDGSGSLAQQVDAWLHGLMAAADLAEPLASAWRQRMQSFIKVAPELKLPSPPPSPSPANTQSTRPTAAKASDGLASDKVGSRGSSKRSRNGIVANSKAAGSVNATGQALPLLEQLQAVLRNMTISMAHAAAEVLAAAPDSNAAQHLRQRADALLQRLNATCCGDIAAEKETGAMQSGSYSESSLLEEAPAMPLNATPYARLMASVHVDAKPAAQEGGREAGEHAHNIKKGSGKRLEKRRMGGQSEAGTGTGQQEARQLKTRESKEEAKSEKARETRMRKQADSLTTKAVDRKEKWKKQEDEETGQLADREAVRLKGQRSKGAQAQAHKSSKAEMRKAAKATRALKQTLRKAQAAAGAHATSQAQEVEHAAQVTQGPAAWRAAGGTLAYAAHELNSLQAPAQAVFDAMASGKVAIAGAQLGHWGEKGQPPPRQQQDQAEEEETGMCFGSAAANALQARLQVAAVPRKVVRQAQVCCRQRPMGLQALNVIGLSCIRNPGNSCSIHILQVADTTYDEFIGACLYIIAVKFQTAVLLLA